LSRAAHQEAGEGTHYLSRHSARGHKWLAVPSWLSPCGELRMNIQPCLRTAGYPSLVQGCQSGCSGL
jgi:hypothetical protein